MPAELLTNDEFETTSFDRRSNVMSNENFESLTASEIKIENEEQRSVFARFSEGVDFALGHTPSVVGKAVFMFGDYIRSQEDRKTIFGTDPVIDPKPLGDRIANAGLRIIHRNQSAIRKKFPEATKGERDFIRDLGSGTVSLATALGIGAIAGPGAAGIAFGASAGSEGFFEARSKGREFKEASRIALMMGSVEGGLEFVGINRLLKSSGGTLKRAVKGYVSEATQEFSQSIGASTIRTATGLREYSGRDDLVEIISDAAYEGAIGGILGGAASIPITIAQKQSVEDGLKEMGMESKQAKETANEIMKKGMDDVMTAVEAEEKIIAREASESTEPGETQEKDLLDEAKKFKTAEEFVKEKANLFHGTDAEFEAFDLNKSKAFGQSKFGHWFTERKDFAEMFGGKVIDAFVNIKNPKIISREEWDTIRQEHAKDGEWFKSWKKELIKQGFDGLRVEGATETFAGQQVESPTIVSAFNDNQVVTKKKLKSIWQQAHGQGQGQETATESKVKTREEIQEEIIQSIKDPGAKRKLQEDFKNVLRGVQEKSSKKEERRLSELEKAEIELEDARFLLKAAEDIQDFPNREQVLNDTEKLIRNVEKKVKRLKEAEFIRRKKTVDLRKEIKNLKKGFREGKALTKLEIKEAQESLIRLLENADVSIEDRKGLFRSFVRKIKNIRDKKQLQKELPDILKRIEKFEESTRKERERRASKRKVLNTIRGKELKKAESLRRFLELPSLNKMTNEQLEDFNNELKKFQKGDEFLSLRKLQTVDNTDLSGVRTVREAKERLAAKLNVDVSALENIEVGPLDKFRYDTVLARQNPFYQFLVDETNASLLDGEQRFLELERELDRKVDAARESRPRSLVEKAVPTDEIVFEWLESPTVEQYAQMEESDREGVRTKEEVSRDMTAEEMELAGFMQEKFSEFRDYLVQHKVLERYQSNYITHIRRGFLEAWKEDGLINAFKEVYKQYQEDEAVFKILEDDTQNILPLEKFFQFAMQRTGGLVPSKNVSKAFKAYTRAMFKKQSLDKIVPALDIYAYSLSPKKTTPRGLQMDRRLIKFVREWVNNKKGRKTSLGGILPQNGTVDIALRTIDSFITLIDLGLNIPVGLTVQVGESVTTFVNLGSKRYSLGMVRAKTKKGKKIIEDNESLVGKSIWRDLADTADTVGDKFHKTLFILFSSANKRANTVHLLGSLTKEEWAAGRISNERLAQIRREMGRFRNISGAKSIFGSTSAGSALTKYKTWAIPILNTIVNDIGTVGSMVRRGNFKETTQSRELNELLRSTLTMTLFVIATRSLIDDEDDSFVGELLNKLRRESLTILQAIDPTLLSSVRILAFLEDLSIALKQLILLEEFKTKPGLKGVSRFRQTIVPRAIQQFGQEDEGKKRK